MRWVGSNPSHLFLSLKEERCVETRGLVFLFLISKENRKNTALLLLCLLQIPIEYSEVCGFKCEKSPGYKYSGALRFVSNEHKDEVMNDYFSHDYNSLLLLNPIKTQWDEETQQSQLQ